MSLLSPETLHLYIAQDKVLGLRTAGLRTRVVAHGRIGVKVDGSDDWNGVGTACNTFLKNMPNVDRIRVVLSSALVRFACVPWRNDLRSPEEELALAKMQFEETYGADTSADWHMAFTDMQAGRARLSVAIPVSLFSLLRGGMAAGMPKIVSIDTSFTCVAHANKKSMPADAWFVNMEAQRLTLGHWNQSGWVWMNSLRAAVQNFEEFAVLLKRELIISGVILNSKEPITVVLNSSVFHAQNVNSKLLDGVRLVFLNAPESSSSILKQDPDYFQLGLPV